MNFAKTSLRVRSRSNKKAFQSNVNWPLADSMGYIVNKFQHVRGRAGPCAGYGQHPVRGGGIRLGSCTEGGTTLYMAPPELTDTAENITSPQLRCWVATKFTSKMVSLGGNRIQKWIRVKQFLFYLRHFSQKI